MNRSHLPAEKSCFALRWPLRRPPHRVGCPNCFRFCLSLPVHRLRLSLVCPRSAQRRTACRMRHRSCPWTVISVRPPREHRWPRTSHPILLPCPCPPRDQRRLRKIRLLSPFAVCLVFSNSMWIYYNVIVIWIFGCAIRTRTQGAWPVW